MKFFTPGSSKIEVIETSFYDIVSTEKDHPRYLKHVSSRIYVLFTYLGIRFGGGVYQGIGTRPACVFFHTGEVENGSFRNFFYATMIS